MGLDAYPINHFRGLNTANDPEEIGKDFALDMSNVDTLRGDRIRVRDGLQRFTGASNLDLSGLRANDIAPFNNGYIAISRHATNFMSLDKVSTGGIITNIGTWGAAGTIYYSHAVLGTLTTTLLFVATDGQLLRKYDGAALAASVGKPRFVTVTTTSNRLVQAYFTAAADSPSGANGSPHTVFFSDPGAPETFTATNFVTLRPGDDENIQAAKASGDFLYIFKDSCFFVFTSESVGGTGLPVFNYRRVDIDGKLLTSTSGRGAAVASAPGGVYYATNRGVFFTSGGPGQLVSQAISTVFEDLTTHDGISWITGRLFINIGSTTYVRDANTGEWMKWSLGTNPSRVVELASGSLPTLISEVATVRNMWHLTDLVTQDDTTAIPAYYQSGFYQPSPGNEVSTRWTKLWGTGAPTFDIYTNHETSDPLSRGGTVTLGTSPQVAKGYHLKGYTGDLLSHKISSTSGVWSVNRVEHDITQVVEIK